jgi:hypothetical protein
MSGPAVVGGTSTSGSDVVPCESGNPPPRLRPGPPTMSLPLSLESLGPSAPVPCPFCVTDLPSPVVFNVLRAMVTSMSTRESTQGMCHRDAPPH